MTIRSKWQKRECSSISIIQYKVQVKCIYNRWYWENSTMVNTLYIVIHVALCGIISCHINLGQNQYLVVNGNHWPNTTADGLTDWVWPHCALWDQNSQENITFGRPAALHVMRIIKWICVENCCIHLHNIAVKSSNANIDDHIFWNKGIEAK